MTLPYRSSTYIIHTPVPGCKKVYSDCDSDSIIFCGVIGFAYHEGKAVLHI